MRAVAPNPIVSLDIMNAAATVVCPTVYSITALPTVAAQENIDYDPVTGIITFRFRLPYSLVIMFNCQGGAGTNTLYGYGEINTGSGFAPIRYSGREKAFNLTNNGQVNFQAQNIFNAGWQLRLGNHAASALNFVTADIPGSTPGTLTTPAIRCVITA